MSTSELNFDTPGWVRVFLGIALIAAGLIVLGDIVLATVVSTVLIGVAAIVGGGFEIVHAFWTKGWGGFVWQIVLGLLYVAAGAYLVAQPESGALVLTWILGIVFVASGLVRSFLGIRHRGEGGWLLLLAGLFGIVAGLIIITGWPVSGLWAIGFLLGVDLFASGVGWLIYAMLGPTRAAS